MRRGGENIAVMTAVCRGNLRVSQRGGPAGLLPLTSLSWPDIPSDEMSSCSPR